VTAFLWLVSLLFFVPAQEVRPTAVTDQPTYNAGESVRVRLVGVAQATASIRYAGEQISLAPGVKVTGDEYAVLWNVPADARTGRYEIDLAVSGNPAIRNAGGFAVHRKVAEITSVDLDKTFYTSGDPVNPRVVVRNLSGSKLDHLRVEFTGYTIPWIAPLPDEAPRWKTLVADDLSLGPGEQKEFRIDKAAVVQAGAAPVVISFAVVLRDSRDTDKIYDLSFVPPAFTIPPNTPQPVQYTTSYLYRRLADLDKAWTYRQFYPSEFVSSTIHFDTTHTMFPAGVPIHIPFTNSSGALAQVKLLNEAGTVTWHKALVNEPAVDLSPLQPGLYTVLIETPSASNRLEIGVNNLPKSLLIFCAHEDDDTAHPGIIRAAIENHIPVHVIYFTGGDAGGCERFYLHTCDAARALNFGEVRLNEARGSLSHLGVPTEDIAFLGLPDGGLGQIWYEHRTASDPYLSVLLASDHSPYLDAAVPNLPFARDAVISAVKDFITRYQPDLIITGHPDERHVDHRTNNWLVVSAMQQLVREGKLSPQTKLVVDVAYGARPGAHAPYKFEKERLFVSGECAKLGQEATWYYQSQDGNHEQGEIVPYAKLPREEPYPHFRVLDWQDHAGWNEK
jgi:LmbE family N-acetylglucosaminyl deacetylase